jgi:hypothetical protein
VHTRQVANDDIVISNGDTIPACLPKATLSSPLVLLSSAKLPMAVLLVPSMLLSGGLTPKAALLKPVVLAESALKPVAVLEPTFVVLERSKTDRGVAAGVHVV